jgi:hypothetical protein
VGTLERGHMNTISKRNHFQMQAMSGDDYTYAATVHCDHVYLIPEYNDNDGMASFWCELCGVSVDSAHVDHHCLGADHKSRWQGVKNLQSCPFSFTCIGLHARIDKLGSQHWQNAIKAHLLRTLIGSDYNYKTFAKKATALVVMYERRERVALLELAVWKAMSIATFQSNFERHGYHEWLEWMRHGWKAANSKMHRCNEIGIVIVAVCPFLE